MTVFRRYSIMLVLAAVPMIGCSEGVDSGKIENDVKEASDQALYDVAYDAYLYAYPLVIMDITMQQSTNVKDNRSVPMRAPFNQFAHFREYPGAESKEVVRFNFDTLYSFAWLDLRKEPVVLSLPDMGDRYYLMPMLDMWSDVFAVPGTRTTGNQAGNFAVVGPSWNGEIDEELEVIHAPTPYVWLMGRTQTNGQKDFDNVHAVQDQYLLTPLDRWRRGERGPGNAEGKINTALDDKTPPLDIINAMTGVELLEHYSRLSLINEPHYPDYPMLHRMEQLGLQDGERWDPGKLDDNQAALINDAARQALQDIKEMVNKGQLGIAKNGWTYATNLGTYGTDYQLRALVALAGLGANLGQDAIYPNAFQDDQGNPTTGQYRYTLEFPADQLPPAQAFWSLTMYDQEGFQVANELNRFAIGDRDDLTFNEDGSLTIYIQHENPGPEKVSNWLPAPEGPFQVMMRIYSPERSVFSTGLNLPPIRKVP